MTRIISIVGGLQPSTPTIGTATAGDTTASVAFTASTYIGKGTITYTATSSPGGLTGTASSSPITVTGLTNGTAYTFTVTGTTNYGVTSIASSSSNSITPALGDAGSMFPLGSVTVGSAGAASITFSSIPSTYTHLQVRGILQTNRSSYIVDLTTVRFNSNTGSNYSDHNLYGGYNTSPNVTSSADTSANRMYFQGLNSGVGANIFTGVVMDILDYANTNKYKTVRNLQGFDVNGTVGTGSLGGTIALSSGNWRSTDAITSVNISMIDGTAFNQYSSLALYGIKGA
jgi:hypothetical protein